MAIDEASNQPGIDLFTAIAGVDPVGLVLVKSAELVKGGGMMLPRKPPGTAAAARIPFG
ncbi:MAG TPA: hypothetical protein VMB04_19560 [Mycobacterium sp.]|nr:hypothetical protein [Mycobacterium sp.]